jgi:23S rRNA pseudouridine2605 synthase
VPKKIEKKAAAATASARPKKPAKLEIELIAAPELKPKPRKTPAKKISPAAAETGKPPVAPAPKAALEPVYVEPAPKKRAPVKTRSVKTSKVAIKDKNGRAAKLNLPVSAPVADPIGDVSDGEARAVEEEADVPATPGESEALATALAQEIKSNEEPRYIPEAPHAADSAPPAKLERLQKILAQAGIASRRRAEEMIVEGRVMVNGQLVTQLGAKADLGRDHIRVDGKLIAGAERHRYFVLNKPRGYVTTVSDPEGRPTVMQFFEKMHMRLYPVGRLDYLSEGLLLVTNDGELANQLTRASLGVEKTYLVKVAGKPTEEELDRLRTGVSIEREGPGSKRVSTAPASIRQVRQGDNPWYEVVLIEGRNRELRKMFEQIGHFVEKIRRVGYGPLVLDVEPGNFRELDADEVKSLQLTAEGKLKPRRTRALPTVPKETASSSGNRAVRGGGGRTFAGRPAQAFDSGSARAPAGRPSRTFDGPPRGRKPESRPGFESRNPEHGARPAFKPRFDTRGTERFGGRAQFPRPEGEQRGESRPFDSQRGSSRPFPKPFRGREDSDSGRAQRFERGNTGFRPQQRSQESDGERAPRRELRPSSERPAFNRGSKPPFNRGGKPDFKRADRPPFKPGGRTDFKRSDRPAFRPGGPGASDRGSHSTFKSERPAFDRGARPPFQRGSKPPFERGARPAFKPSERPPFKRDDRPPFQQRPDTGGAFEGRPSRPPGRTFGSRPAGKPAGRPSGAKSSGRPSSGRKFGAGAPRKPGSRPGGKFKPRWDRKRP